MITSVSLPLTFTSRTERQKENEKKAVAGGGAVAAISQTVHKKALKQSFFNAKKGANLMSNLSKKMPKLFTKVADNVKFIKNLAIQNKYFKWCAKPISYVFGAITLISGLADIGKCVTDTVEKVS